MQGGIRTFVPPLLRHSNTDIQSTRTTNSIDATQPALASPSSLLVNRITSSMFNVNSTTQLLNSNNNNNPQSTIHSVQSINHPPISGLYLLCICKFFRHFISEL